MKMKLGVTVGGVALLALTIGFLSTASASPTHRHELHLHFLQPANTDQLTQVDANHNNKFDTGDYVIDNGPLYNASGSRRVGAFKSIFNVMDKSHFMVRTVFLLHGGQITSDGVINSAQTKLRVDITGGTSTYKTAGGDIRVVVGTKGETDFFFDLFLLGGH